MKWFITFAILLMLILGFTDRLYANGDPTARLSAVERSANPAPRTITDIHVIREELRLKPGIYTEVSVRYFLWNNSNKDYKDIDYAFPIDYQGSGEELINSNLISADYSESSYILGWHDDYIKDVVFWANGISLPFEVSPEIVVQKPDDPVVQDPQDMETFGAWTEEQSKMAYVSQTIGRKWFYTQFSIGAGEVMLLDVHYSLRNDASIDAYEGINKYWRHASFYYDLSPAAHWGNGIAREIDIEIDISGISNLSYNEDYFHYMYPNDNKQPLKFTKENDKLVFRDRNYNFSTSLPIYFDYSNPTLPSLGEWLPYRIDNDQYTMIVSSENAIYPSSNLTDMDLQTAWAIPWKKDEQVSINIKFKKPVQLGAIFLLPGYYKSKNTFLENCRPGYIEVLADVLHEEEVYDEKADGYIYTGKYVESTESYNISDQERLNEYEEVTFNNLPAYSINAQRYAWNRSFVKEITINLLDIIQGTKYDDLCITELILLNDKVFLTNRIGK